MRVYKYPSKPNPQFQTQENPVLYVISTFWPFVFFTDILIIREKSITIVNKLFFISVWSDTFSINTLTGAILSTDIFFASLTIMRKYPSAKYELIFLKKNEAIKAKELIDGLLLAKEKLIIIPKDISIEEKVKILQESSREDILNEDIKRL